MKFCLWFLGFFSPPKCALRMVQFAAAWICRWHHRPRSSARWVSPIRWSPEVSPFESPRGQLWSGYIRWIAAFRSCEQSWVFSLSLVPCYSPGIVCKPMFARRCCAIPDAWFEPCIPYSDNLDGIGESAFMTTGDQDKSSSPAECTQVKNAYWSNPAQRGMPINDK